MDEALLGLLAQHEEVLRAHLSEERGGGVNPGEIERVLLEHPAVREAVVVTRETPTGEPRLLAFVGTESEPLEVEAWGRERTERWSAIWSELYRLGEHQAADPAFDVVGWYSTYTARPLPEE